jgi:hypothetical protein
MKSPISSKSVEPTFRLGRGWSHDRHKYTIWLSPVKRPWQRPPDRARNTRSSFPLGDARNCVWPRPSPVSAVGQDAPGLPLQDSDEMNGISVALVLLYLSF